MGGRDAAAALVGLLLLTGCGDGGPTPTPADRPAATSSPSPTARPTGPAEAPEGSPTASPAATDIADVRLGLEEVASGLEAPLHVLPAPGGGLLVLEQPGRIQLVRDGEVSTYLDIVDRVVAGGERGLLGAVFPPAYPEDDRLFVHYSGAGGRTTLATFTAGADAADPASEEILLTVDQPAANHNGGQVAFGPDGMLYLGLGDGGGANDRFDNGQDPTTLLGTMLRLDVTGVEGGGYDIPPDNPFADGDGGAPEVWAYGLRNPYRFAFGDGRIYIADVGQNAVEEIDAEPDDAPGINYGWPILEGPDCFAEPDCDPSGTALPVAWYRHEDTGGCALIGGEFYAGETLAALDGWYLYSDLCAGFLRAVRVADDGTVDEADLSDQVESLAGVLGFGHDAEGEVLVGLQDGRVLRLVPASGSPG